MFLTVCFISALLNDFIHLFSFISVIIIIAAVSNLKSTLIRSLKVKVSL